MRSAKRSKAPKKPYKDERIHKKRHKNTSKMSWGWNDDLSGLFIDDINEAIRTRKARRTDGKACWRLVPKDSCEIYKDRKRRTAATRRRSEFTSEDMSNDNESRMEEDKKDKRKLRKKKIKGIIPGTTKALTKKKRKTRTISYRSSISTVNTVNTVIYSTGSSTSHSSYYGSDNSYMDSCHCYD